MAKVVIAMPVAQANVKMHATQTVVDTSLALQAAGHEVEFFAAEFSEVVWARNMLASHALTRGATHLFFIDSDMYFPPEVSLRLLAADRAVIGAICPRRRISLDAFAAAARRNSAAPASEVMARVLDYCPAKPAFEDGVVEVLGVGMAVTMIKAEVLRAMIAGQAARLTAPRAGVQIPVYDFFGLARDERGEDMSEDFSFCARWIAAGGKVHAMDAPRVGHVGDFVYRGSYLDSLKPSAG